MPELAGRPVDSAHTVCNLSCFILRQLSTTILLYFAYPYSININ